MKIAVAESHEQHPARALDLAWLSLLNDLPEHPHLLLVFATVGYQIAELVEALGGLPPYVQILGSTSCQGVMTPAGFSSEPGGNLGILGICDPDGAYGVGITDVTPDLAQASQRALQLAIEAAGRPGEMPDLVFVSTSPGIEEEVILGIESILGKNVPIIGGSAADNTVSGQWQIFSRGSQFGEGIGLAVLYSSSKLLFAFHSGYDPTGQRALITRADDRTLFELDHLPAAERYNQWTDGLIADTLAQGSGNILAQTTLQPLGRLVGKIGDVSYFQLSHPDQILPGGALTLFSDVQAGDEIWLMQGTPDSLISRAGNVASAALAMQDHLEQARVLGAMVIYCAGCMLTVQDRMSEVCESLRSALGGAPFLGAFTFGEQGCFPGGENRHGNLMISVLVFYNA